MLKTERAKGERERKERVNNVREPEPKSRRLALQRLADRSLEGHSFV